MAGLADQALLVDLADSLAAALAILSHRGGMAVREVQAVVVEGAVAVLPDQLALERMAELAMTLHLPALVAVAVAVDLTADRQALVETHPEKRVERAARALADRAAAHRVVALDLLAAVAVAPIVPRPRQVERADQILLSRHMAAAVAVVAPVLIAVMSQAEQVDYTAAAVVAVEVRIARPAVPVGRV